MKTLLVLFSLSVAACISYGQENETEETPTKKQTLHLFLAGSVGNFGMNTDKFNEMYSNRSVSRIYTAGIGDQNAFLFGKYRQFFARGHSKVVNATAEGWAEWNQKFYTIGGRLMSVQSPIYLEFGYVISEAEEKISVREEQPTDLPSKLSSQFKFKAQGIGMGIGFAINFPKPFRIFGEYEYTSMLKLGNNPSGRAVPQIGGSCLSAGVMLIL